MVERLILVRHGETIHNVEGIAQGWSDSELSPQGRRQVAAAATRLAEFGATSLYCSTLPRAITTAEVIGGDLGMQPEALHDLREMNCGEWEGREFLQVRKDDPDFYRRWVSDPTVACPGGESYRDVLQRLKAAFAVIERDGGARPVVVSHGTSIRIAATALLDLSLHAARNFAQDNAAINVFERRLERYILLRWNDTSHFDGALR
jgi:broad specificity phosphatase PhoE